MRYKHNYNKEYILYKTNEEQQTAVELGIKQINTYRPNNKPIIGITFGITLVDNDTIHYSKEFNKLIPVVPWKTIYSRILNIKPFNL